MARKRKTLPKNFDELLSAASIDELKEVFIQCDLEATGGYGKKTAVGFEDCPDELLRWLVDKGANVNAVDPYGRSPLWWRAYFGRDEQIPLLLALGADIEQKDNKGCTPLHAATMLQKFDTARILLEHGANPHAIDEQGDNPLLVGLKRTQNIGIVGMARIAKLLLAKGVQRTAEMTLEVQKLGKEFEFHRANFNPEYLAETDAALKELYQLFEAQAVEMRLVHTGVSRIEVPEGTWHEQFEALWRLLVPGQGVAHSKQGEVIRIAGKVADEIQRNGGGNWDKDYRNMLKTMLGYLADGKSLPQAQLKEAKDLISALQQGDGDDSQLHHLAKLALEWVKLNPDPFPLEAFAYKR